MNRSSFVRAFGALAAIAAVTCLNLAARADVLTQSELPQVFPVAAPPSAGSQGFVDLGTPTVNTGNIDTATSFTIADLRTTSANVLYFAGFPALSTTFTPSPITFTVGSGTSLSFSAFSGPDFGSFVSSSITEDASGPGFRTFTFVGSYTAGSYFEGSPLIPNPAPASFRIAFTQTPVGTGAISNSATLAIPPVPEPSTMMLAVVGIAGGLVVHQSNRQRRNRAAGVSGSGDDHSSTITE
jgi:hypothetical protein